MRSLLGGLAMLALASPVARADVGPIDPARKICMGVPEGDPCVIDGKPGTCHGPHPSRMSCDPKRPPAQEPGSVTASGSGWTPGGAGSSAPAAESGSGAAPAPSSAGSSAPAPAEPTPGHKRGCAVAEPGAAPILLALAAVLVARRRRSR